MSYHLRRELIAIGRFETITDYAALNADFFGTFHDLRSVNCETEQALHQEPRIAYPAGQALARRLRLEADSNGIVYPSARRHNATCLVAFRPDLVQNLRQGSVVWRLQWQGSSMPSAARLEGP